MNAPPSMASELRHLGIPLMAVFIVAMGYGIVLPVLPFVLARLPTDGANQFVALHTGLLTASYMFSLFLFSPIWGRLSDRLGRRSVILAGIAGFSGATLAFAFIQTLPMAYGVRILAGMFAAAVVPVVYASTGDDATPQARARAFAWLSAASAFGFLFGPTLSAWLMPARAADGHFALPFYAVSLLGVIVWLAAFWWLPAAPIQSIRGKLPKSGAPYLIALLALSLLATFGLGSFEVGLALEGQQTLGLGPRQVEIMFSECSLVMILVQAFALPALITRTGGRSLLAPALAAMAAGLVVLPFSANFGGLLLTVGLIAAAGGILIPALAYLVSLTAGTGQGLAFGAQTAAVSLGQAVGSAAAGWLFPLHHGAPFWVTAGLLVLGAMTAHFARIVWKPLDEAGHRRPESSDVREIKG